MSSPRRLARASNFGSRSRSAVTDTPIRLALADDHAIVLQGLRQLFLRHEEFDVVACCRDGHETLAALRRGGVDVLVLDFRMPGFDGLDVLRTMATEGISCPTVLLTATIGDAEVVEALRLGVKGLVLKESPPETLLECVRSVYAGGQYVEPQTMSRAFSRVLKGEEAARQVSKLLTQRELEVVRLIAQGHRNRTIAERLSISEGTVKIHLHNIYSKLGIDGRLELVLWFQAQGLL